MINRWRLTNSPKPMAQLKLNKKECVNTAFIKYYMRKKIETTINKKGMSFKSHKAIFEDCNNISLLIV